jgi:hypothetical protein
MFESFCVKFSLAVVARAANPMLRQIQEWTPELDISRKGAQKNSSVAYSPLAVSSGACPRSAPGAKRPLIRKQPLVPDNE